MHWTLRLAGLVAVLGLLGPATRPANAQELTRLRVLLVFDTSDKQLGKGLEKHDLPRVSRTLRGNVPTSRMTIDVLKGKGVMRKQILAHYQTLKTGPNEGLLFFYGGHGATDKETGRHALTLTNEDVLFRYELREAMEAKKAGLVVIISDCCSDLKKIAK